MAIDKLPVKLTGCLESVCTSTENLAGEIGTVRLKRRDYQYSSRTEGTGHSILQMTCTPESVSVPG